MKSLTELIDANEGNVVTVTFVDGEELKLELLHRFKDIGEDPQGHATVQIEAKKWKVGSAIVYDLGDVAEVRDEAGTVIFERDE